MLAKHIIFSSNRSMTKGELSKELYPSKDFTVDCAVPQAFLDKLSERGLDDYLSGSPASHFCMVYPESNELQFLAPLTDQAIKVMSILATYGGN